MLAITTPDSCYVEDLLKKLNYEKEKSPNKTEIYKCNYKEHIFIIMVTGYGKINQGSALRYLCDNYPIKVILSIGTAGSITNENEIFCAMIPNYTLQFDVDFIPNGYKEAQIPGIDINMYKTNDDIVECLKRIVSLNGVKYSLNHIASSDMFVNNYNLSNSIKRQYNAGAVDCESGSIGEFCYINDIHYACLKIISNYANNNGIKQFNMNDEESSRILQRLTYKFLKEFYEA